jgi:hypothetical protein
LQRRAERVAQPGSLGALAFNFLAWPYWVGPVGFRLFNLPFKELINVVDSAGAAMKVLASQKRMHRGSWPGRRPGDEAGLRAADARCVVGASPVVGVE